MYGLSKVLPMETVPLLNCSAYSGEGEVAVKASEEMISYKKTISWNNDVILKPWGNYQWRKSDLFGHAPWISACPLV